MKLSKLIVALCLSSISTAFASELDSDTENRYPSQNSATIEGTAKRRPSKRAAASKARETIRRVSQKKTNNMRPFGLRKKILGSPECVMLVLGKLPSAIQAPREESPFSMQEDPLATAQPLLECDEAFKEINENDDSSNHPATAYTPYTPSQNETSLFIEEHTTPHLLHRVKSLSKEDLAFFK